MPRIDPIQLLKCLSVLLSPNGGIRSNDEVHRLASLMTKFSKKLVSKCIYIQILKCTETKLLGSFMGSGGWRLAHMWLTESIAAKNWPLVRELLELLLLCPVDIDRLKTNNCPKLVKELSKDGSQSAIRALAEKLVEQWLKTVKGEPVLPVSESDFPQIIAQGQNFSSNDSTCNDAVTEFSNIKDDPDKKVTNCNKENVSEETVNKNEETTPLPVEIAHIKEENIKEEALPILKISLKDGKQFISKIDDGNDDKDEKNSSDKDKDHKSIKTKIKSDDAKSSRSSSKHSSSSKSHSSKSSSDKHKSNSKSSSSSSSNKDKHKESSRHSSSTEKHKDKKLSDKSYSSSSKSKIEKSKSEKSHKSDKHKDERTHKNRSKTLSEKELIKEVNEKNNDSNEKKDLPIKLQPSINKLMKIPKISEAVKKESPSISIESRKPNDPNRPKTVKTFHSKFRSHGLEEEAKPPPPRGSVLKKAPPPILPTVAIPKRPSPSHSIEQPPEKKSKIIEPQEKPGSIKLIPAKPKPALLLESDMFMDALNACATNKKEPKKRKRRTSGSKDGNPSTDMSPPSTPTAPAPSSSPSQETKSTPFRFYKDTLEAEEEKDQIIDNDTKITENNESAVLLTEEIIEDESHVRSTASGLRGVLCYHKKKGPKKSIRWKPDTELEQIQYFELDETERVNVSKTFSDMKNLERVHEREAVQKARNLLNDDVMEVKTMWRPLIPVDIGGAIVVEYGKHSKEKDLQAARQKSVLQSLYLKTMIPDAPSEPDPETHAHSEPTIIPLDDITGNPDTVSDFRSTPWPEPKGSGPSPNPVSSGMGMPPMFPPMSQFPGPFPTSQFGMPSGIMPPGGDWQNNIPPNVMMPPGAIPPGAMPPGPMVQGPGPMPPMLMNPGNMPPGVMMPPDGMIGPEMFGGPPGQNMFPMPPEGFNIIDAMNGPPNMFPPGFPVNMQGPCPPGPENANSFPYGNRGGMRGRGSSNQWRGSWDGPGRGRGGNSQGGWKKAKCIHFLKKGSCRSGESCAFQHPGVNCPF